MNRFVLAAASLLLALASAGASYAQFGAESADPGTSFNDYKRCYAVDYWRLSQAQARTPPADDAELHAIQQEAQSLATLGIAAAVAQRRSQDSAMNELRSYTATQTALYQRESADGAVSRHSHDDEAFCQRNGLIDEHRRH